MPKVMMVCRVCGREYEACRSQSPNLASTFRWQDVACSPECGAEYLKRVMIARGELVPEEEKGKAAQPAEEKTVTKPARKKKAASAKADKPAE